MEASLDLIVAIDRVLCEKGNQCQHCKVIREALEAKAARPEARLSVELLTLLKVCRMCDLHYGAHDQYYGLGQTVFGVEITKDTDVADLVDAAIALGKKPEREPQNRSDT